MAVRNRERHRRAGLRVGLAQCARCPRPVATNGVARRPDNCAWRSVTGRRQRHSASMQQRCGVRAGRRRRAARAAGRECGCERRPRARPVDLAVARSSRGVGRRALVLRRLLREPRPAARSSSVRPAGSAPMRRGRASSSRSFRSWPIGAGATASIGPASSAGMTRMIVMPVSGRRRESRGGRARRRASAAAATRAR